MVIARGHNPNFLSMPTQAHITVYLQALGAHYLGANALNVNDIRILLSRLGEDPLQIPYTKNPNDGMNSPTYASGSTSFMPIQSVPATPNTVRTTFVLSDAETTCGRANFELPSQIEFAYLDISIPTSSSSPMTMRYPVLLNPEKLNYVVTAVVPGLYLSPLFQIQNPVTNNALGVYVKMMCGCPVDYVAPGLWLPNDFTVHAYVVNDLGQTTLYPMTFMDQPESKSLFTCTLAPGQTVKSVTYTAIQISTNNYGVLVG